MSSKTVYTCDNAVCDHTTEQPERDEWIVLDGILSAYQGVREGVEPDGPVPAVRLEGFRHFCAMACLQSALEFPDKVVGQDASEEVGQPA